MRKKEHGKGATVSYNKRYGRQCAPQLHKQRRFDGKMCYVSVDFRRSRKRCCVGTAETPYQASRQRSTQVAKRVPFSSSSSSSKAITLRGSRSPQLCPRTLRVPIAICCKQLGRRQGHLHQHASCLVHRTRCTQPLQYEAVSKDRHKAQQLEVTSTNTQST